MNCELTAEVLNADLQYLWPNTTLPVLEVQQQANGTYTSYLRKRYEDEDSQERPPPGPGRAYSDHTFNRATEMEAILKTRWSMHMLATLCRQRMHEMSQGPEPCCTVKYTVMQGRCDCCAGGSTHVEVTEPVLGEPYEGLKRGIMLLPSTLYQGLMRGIKLIPLMIWGKKEQS